MDRNYSNWSPGCSRLSMMCNDATLSSDLTPFLFVNFRFSLFDDTQPSLFDSLLIPKSQFLLDQVAARLSGAQWTNAYHSRWVSDNFFADNSSSDLVIQYLDIGGSVT